MGDQGPGGGEPRAGAVPAWGSEARAGVALSCAEVWLGSRRSRAGVKTVPFP